MTRFSKGLNENRLLLFLIGTIRGTSAMLHSLRTSNPNAAPAEPVTVLYNKGIGCSEATARSGAISGRTKLIGS